MSPGAPGGSGTSHLMSALCRSEERRERERGVEEIEMSVALADPLISCWRGFFNLPGQLRTGGGPPHEPFDEGSAWIFVRGQPGTLQNELIASTSLWTTDSPPGAMTLLPHGARRPLSCRSWFPPKPQQVKLRRPLVRRRAEQYKVFIGKTNRTIEA